MFLENPKKFHAYITTGCDSAYSTAVAASRKFHEIGHYSSRKMYDEDLRENKAFRQFVSFCDANDILPEVDWLISKWLIG
jgi:hypothetical protein